MLQPCLCALCCRLFLRCADLRLIHQGNWATSQCIKESSTLRVSSKGAKPFPRIVHRYGKQDEQIELFLKTRSQIKRIIKKPELSGIKESDRSIAV